MKKSYISLCLAAALVGFGFQAQAQTQPWNSISVYQLPADLNQYVFPTEFTAYQMDITAIQALLDQAGNSFQTGVDIKLPLGDRIQTLRVWRDDVLAPELAAQFPEIRSFTGVDPNNHAISAKLDLNHMGFSGMIIHPEEGSFMIDPYSLKSQDYYLGFWRRDLDPNIYKTGFCGTRDEEVVPLSTSELIPSPNLDSRSNEADLLRANGSIKRTYRAAISCTGEWANMITGGAPSVPSVLSAMATIMNRCNGVFQRELSVKMEIIANNNEIVYIDPASDPYTCVGESHDCLIDQVKSNLDDVLPVNSYDIGHIFCTTGGGLAQLNAVCGSGKARGVSGVFTTSDIGTIIHEMGHQMGTGHTFNANTGGCEGNGSETSAYEPGAGTSIMSYSGMCAPNNVTLPTSDYYHVASLEMMTDFIVFGGGATCGTVSPGVTPISISPIAATHNIPLNTPFELSTDEPTTSEPAPPEVTFSWEQWDLGNFGETEAEAGNWEEGPTFESRAPISRKDRQFPDNSLVAAGTYAVAGQRLPLVARELNFKLTNRSYFEGWGTFNYSDDVVTINAVESDPFRVTKPDVTTLYEVGAPILITWDTVNTRQDPISCGFVNIFLSINGGETFPFQVVANAPNIGSYTLAAPNVYSDNIRFKVKASGNVFYDISKTDIRIHGESVGIDDENLLANSLKIYPNPTDNMLFLRNEIAAKEPLQVRMVNLAGQTVYTGAFLQNLDINVGSLAAGTYLLQVVDPATSQSKTEKIVVK